MIRLALLSRLATGLLIPMVPANAQGVLTVAMTAGASVDFLPAVKRLMSG